ncbi:MAG: hypothetical protein Q8P28_04225 [Deltaproteobacteria bacterium]|nr:hypothetical protein [Deltaproteobacteria bacterium]
MQEMIPILSLIVAILAVLFGPIISWKIAKRQVSFSLKIANKQIVAPMRQAWINSLRDLIAEISSSALHYFQTGYEDRRDEEYKRLTELEGKISLMLNFKEDDHKKLHDLIREMLGALSRGKEGDNAFIGVHPTVMALARDILKREWNRVKEEIPLT